MNSSRRKPPAASLGRLRPAEMRTAGPHPRGPVADRERALMALAEEIAHFTPEIPRWLQGLGE